MAELMSLSWMLIGSNKKGIVPPLSVSSVPAADMDESEDDEVGSNNLLPTDSTIPAKKGSGRRNSSTTPKRSETGVRDNMNKSPKNSILADKVADRTDRERWCCY
jgi:hypothetical protein